MFRREIVVFFRHSAKHLRTFEEGPDAEEIGFYSFASLGADNL